MPSLIYDNTLQAYKESEKPKLWHSDVSAYGQAEGKMFVTSKDAWGDAWTNRLPDIWLSDVEGSDSEDYYAYAQSDGVSASVYVSQNASTYYNQGYRYITYTLQASSRIKYNTAYPGTSNTDLLSTSAWYYTYSENSSYPSSNYLSGSKYFNRYTSVSSPWSQIGCSFSSVRIKTLLPKSGYPTLGGVYARINGTGYSDDGIWWRYDDLSELSCWCKASSIVLSVD